MLSVEERKQLGRSNGGKVTATIRYDQSVIRYYKKPNYCSECGNIIEIAGDQRVQDVRKKKFCNHSCAAIYNGKRRVRIKVVKNNCLICGIPIRVNSVYCRNCYNANGLLIETKGSLKNRLSPTSYGSIFVSHAKSIFTKSGKPNKCIVCGYDKHIDICHVKSIASFDDCATVGKINNIGNLVGLCPNHHWEYDKGDMDIVPFL